MSELLPARDSRIDLRVTKEQKELLEKAATLKGISLSAYTLFHLLNIAKQDIEAHERPILSDRDRDLFMSVIKHEFIPFQDRPLSLFLPMTTILKETMESL